MTQRLNLILLVISSFSLPLQALATVDYVPASKDAKNTTINTVLKTFRNDFDFVIADAVSEKDAGSIVLECATPPKYSDLSTFEKRNSNLSAKAALDLRLPLVSGGVTADERVLIQESTKSKQCLSKDGKTWLLYGQTIRTVVNMTNIGTNVSYNVAAAAANATLNRQHNAVKIYVTGFVSKKMEEAANSIFAGDLTVENYGELAALQKKLADLALDADTQNVVEFLGVVPDAANSDLSSNVLTAFAVQQVAAGKSCDDTKSKLNKATADQLTAITGTYLNLMGVCNSNAPNDAQRYYAKQALVFGITVKK